MIVRCSETPGIDPVGSAGSADGSGNRVKQVVAASSVAAAVALTGMKLVVGLATGSLGILSEAMHSALDLVAALVTWFAVRTSARPADPGHLFGHGKVENLSALLETVLLLATCVWIVVEALKRLAGAPVHVEASVWAFAVMAVSIIVDLSRSRALRKVAVATGSQALEADALHFATDVWSSSVVIAGLVLVRVADSLRMPWLVQADAVAALGVAAIVVWVSLRLGQRTVADLLDAVPPGLRDRLESAAHVHGVAAVGRVRVRRSGAEHFVDLTLRAEPGLTLECAHAIADRAEEAIRGVVPGADVMVHLEPDPWAPGPTELPSTTAVRALADGVGVGVHGMHLEASGDGAVLELHVEVDPSLDVAGAHAQATALEEVVCARYPGVERVITHLEPRARSETAADARHRAVLAVAQAAEQVAADRGVRCVVRDVTVTPGDEGLAISFVCETEATAAITEAHAFTAGLEAELRSRLSDVERVSIHLEPAAG